MKSITFFMCSVVVVVLVFSVALIARAEDGKQTSLDSLLGKYEGIFQSHGKRTFEFSYQAEILSVDTLANTVSLVAYCRDCESAQEWRRDNCKVTYAKESIRFVCKGKNADEEYTVSDGKMKVTGFGKKYPYTITATKVVK